MRRRIRGVSPERCRQKLRREDYADYLFNKQAAEKYRVSKPSSPRAVNKSVAKVAAHAAVKANVSVASTHRMVTRHRSKHFRLLELPQEIQDNIYSLVLRSERSPGLATFRLPPLMFVSRQIRTAALPTYFAVNSFTGFVKRNCSTFNRNPYVGGRVGYAETGKVGLSPVLRKSQNSTTVSDSLKAIVRFHNLNLSICCGCFVGEHVLGTVNVHVEGRKLLCSLSGGEANDKLTDGSLQVILGYVQSVGERIGSREVFNGLTIQDVKDIARCFTQKANEIA